MDENQNNLVAKINEQINFYNAHNTIQPVFSKLDSEDRKAREEKNKKLKGILDAVDNSKTNNSNNNQANLSEGYIPEEKPGLLSRISNKLSSPWVKYPSIITGVGILVSQVSCGGIVTPNPPSQEIVIPASFDWDYFIEVCMQSEFGASTDIIRPTIRWTTNPCYYLINPPNEELRQIAEDITKNVLLEFTNGVIVPYLTDNINSADVTVKWCDKDDMPYGGFGSTTVHHKNFVINKAEIFLQNNIQNERIKHVYLEEFTQALGPVNDSDKYPDSIFYDLYSEVSEYSKEDLEIGYVLYQLSPGTKLEDIPKSIVKSIYLRNNYHEIIFEKDGIIEFTSGGKSFNIQKN
jgi:hypothetical protein